MLGFVEGVAMEFEEDFEFEGAEFAIGDDEEIAAAAGGIEEGERAEFDLERFQTGGAAGGFVDAGGIELGAEFVEEQRTDQF